jgi:O-antigen/teichoic acid export membrane protein
VRRIPRWFSWGLADQAMSSATNFGLTLLAGRALGPEGLGVVFLGFAMYLLSLALHRALVFDPLVVTTAPLDAGERAAKTAGGLSTTLAGGLLATTAMVVVGLTVDAPLARGMLVFSPWVLPAMLQDLWRALLFRDDRGGAAALNDLVWVAGMVVTLPFAVVAGGEWAIVGCWGAGTLAAAIVGFFQTRLRPGRLGAAARWWRSEALPLGRWLAAASLVYIGGLQLVVFLLASVLGPSAIGGFRAVQTLFAPMTLLGPAASLPGLPRLARGVHVDPSEARRFASKISAAIATLAFVYVGAVLLGGSGLLGLVFGRDFAGYEDLIVPMSVGQLLLAAGLGYSLLLKAAKRGDSLLITRSTAAVATLAFAPLLGSRYGLIGAAWGFVIASVLENGTVIAFAFSDRFGRLREDAPAAPAAPLAAADRPL